MAQVELASDSGHMIDSAPQTAYISGKQQDVVQLYFGNSPKGSLLVKKIDSAPVLLWITGASGAFGRACALALGASGAKLVLVSGSTEELKDVAEREAVLAAERETSLQTELAAANVP